MNEEQIRKIAKETFDKNIMNNLDSSIVFKYVQTLEKENKKYKEVINKAIKHVSSLSSRGRDCMIYADVKKDILDILKEVEHEKSNN